MKQNLKVSQAEEIERIEREEDEEY